MLQGRNRNKDQVRIQKGVFYQMKIDVPDAQNRPRAGGLSTRPRSIALVLALKAIEYIQ